MPMTRSAPMSRPAPARRLLPALLALAALATAALSLSAQEATPLVGGETVEGPLAPGDTLRYALQVGEDFWIRGRVEQDGVDARVRLLDAEGRQQRNLPGRTRGTDRFWMTVDDEPAGKWELQVIGREDDEGEGAAGRYRLVLEALEPQATDPKALAEQLLGVWDGDDMPGAAIRVWRDGRTLYTNTWGMANLAYHVPWTPDTRTNIGSTSKQFTAFAVRLLAERGELSLDDPVREYVPELPAFDDTVRIRHILTHTSGYRELFNLLLMTGRRIGEGDYVDRDEVIAVVQAQPALQNDPGAEFNYNNTAFALAALVVERVSGQSFPDFMRENVFEPLGMDRTLVRAHAEQIVEERSMGYAPADEGFREIRDLGAAVGAGAIYSTLPDLQTWAENYLEPRVGSEAMVEDMTTRFVTTGGDTTSYGLGLFVDEQRGLRRVHHGGADIAHRSMLAMYPEIRAGITVQSNHANFDSGIAFRLAEAFFGDAMEPEEEEEAVAEGAEFDAEAYDPEAFDAFTGRYAMDANPAFVVELTREGEALHAQATGQRRLDLVPTSDTTFQIQDLPASFTVVRDDEGAPEAILLHQGGQTQRASRLEQEAAADGWPPEGREALEAFEGRYLSREIETFYTIAVTEDEDGEPGLVLRQRRLGEMALAPGEEDAFSTTTDGGPLQLSFERDRAGRVIAFYMSNGRTRDVRFERLP